MKHVVQRSNGASVPSGPRTVATSCSTPVAGSYSSPASRCRTANAAENALTASAPPGRSGGGDPAEHVGLVAPAEQPEAALAQADGGVELAGPVEVAHVELLEGRARGRRPRPPHGPDATNSALWSTPTTSKPAPGERERVPTRPAPHVEHPHPGLERERVDQEVDLLLVPLVNALRRYAGPRKSATASNQYGVTHVSAPLRRHSHAVAAPNRGATSRRPSWGRSRCRR